jgi:hypothetical protein
MIRVLHFNKSGLGNIEFLTTMEHMEIKEIHNHVIDLNK